jgi:hypothetical protein
MLVATNGSASVGIAMPIFTDNFLHIFFNSLHACSVQLTFHSVPQGQCLRQGQGTGYRDESV